MNAGNKWTIGYAWSAVRSAVADTKMGMLTNISCLLDTPSLWTWRHKECGTILQIAFLIVCRQYAPNGLWCSRTTPRTYQIVVKLHSKVPFGSIVLWFLNSLRDKGCIMKRSNKARVQPIISSRGSWISPYRACNNSYKSVSIVIRRQTRRTGRYARGTISSLNSCGVSNSKLQSMRQSLKENQKFNCKTKKSSDAGRSSASWTQRSGRWSGS